LCEEAFEFERVEEKRERSGERKFVSLSDRTETSRNFARGKNTLGGTEMLFDWIRACLGNDVEGEGMVERASEVERIDRCEGRRTKTGNHFAREFVAKNIQPT
jgi:hypothetical protein